MRIREIVLDAVIRTRLFEMATERKRVIERLTNLQDQINLHALKIIIYPDSRDITHWKNEISAWGNSLAGILLRNNKQSMGFDLAWKYLYIEPFEHVEKQALAFRLQQLQASYPYQITKQPEQIMAEYMAFIRPFCEVIGRGELVNTVVSALGQPLIRTMETAAE